MSKSAFTGTSKADIAINNVQREIRQMNQRDWLSITEQLTLDGKQRAKQAQPVTVTQVRVSHYNADAPLRGSKYWSVEQWDVFKAKVKADKAATKLANKL